MSNVVRAARKPYITVGNSFADYVVTGTADNVALQAAIDKAHANAALSPKGLSTVQITSPLVLANVITMYKDVRLKFFGAHTPVSIASNFAAGVVFREQSGDATGLTIEDLTLDLAGKADVGGIHIYQGNFIYLKNLHVKNQTYSSASKWAVRIGNYTSGSPDGTASHGTILENLKVTNCNCGTYEQLLFVNQQDARIVNPYFENNTNSLAYELMLYINNKNVVVQGAHFESSSANSIGMMESDGLILTGITANHNGNYKLVTIINCANVLFDGIDANNTVASPTNPAVEFFDRLLGPDGFTQLVDDTNNICFQNVSFRGWKYVVSCQNVGTLSGTDYTMNQNYVQFVNCVIQATGTAPFILGADGSGNNLHDWDFNNVKVLSWSGTNTGAWQLRGYTSVPGQMYGFRFSKCLVNASSGGGANAAIRAISMTVQLLDDCVFSGTFTTYGLLSVVTGGVFQQVRNHLISTTAPAAGDDLADGLGVGSRWYDTTGDREYVCIDGTVGAAVWLSTLKITGDTMTGDLIVPDEAYGSGWNGSLEVPTKNAVYDKIETIGNGAAVGTLFTQTADKTVTNTVTETSIIGTGVGNLTLPANFFVAGRTVRLRVGGIYSTPALATPSIIIKVKYGSTVIATITTSSLLSGATNLEFDGEILMTCRTTGSSGTVMVHGDIEYATGVAGTISVDPLNNAGATTTINTTTSNALDITCQWDSATSTRIVKSTVTSIEVLN